MNKEYMYWDGKVIVCDDKVGLPTEIEYFDNIDEMLVTENLIEEMETNLTKKQKELRECKASKKGAKRFALMPALLFAAGSVTFPFILGVPTLVAAVAFPVVNLFGVLFSGKLYENYKDLLKEIDGLQGEVDFLAERYEKENRKLDELKKKKTKKNEKEFSGKFISRKVDDKAQMKELNDQMALYHDTGANAKKYLGYQANGTLKENLAKKQYTEYEVGLVEAYLDAISQQQGNGEKSQDKVLQKGAKK